MLLWIWIVVLLQGIAILSLSISLKKQREVIEMIFDFINESHTMELHDYLVEKHNEEELKNRDK